MGRNPVVHFEIAGLQFGRTKKFFENVFEWEIQEWKDSALKYGMTSHSGAGTIGGGIMETAEEYGGPFTVFYIQVDDLKAYLAKIEANGGKTLAPPRAIPGIGSSAMFADPDGNVIGLFSEKQQVD